MRTAPRRFGWQRHSGIRASRTRLSFVIQIDMVVMLIRSGVPPSLTDRTS